MMCCVFALVPSRVRMNLRRLVSAGACGLALAFPAASVSATGQNLNSLTVGTMISNVGIGPTGAALLRPDSGPVQPSAWGDWPRWGDQRDGTYRNPVIPADYSELDMNPAVRFVVLHRIIEKVKQNLAKARGVCVQRGIVAEDKIHCNSKGIAKDARIIDRLSHELVEIQPLPGNHRHPRIGLRGQCERVHEPAKPVELLRLAQQPGALGRSDRGIAQG